MELAPTISAEVVPNVNLVRKRFGLIFSMIYIYISIIDIFSRTNKRYRWK